MLKYDSQTLKINSQALKNDPQALKNDCPPEFFLAFPDFPGFPQVFSAARPIFSALPGIFQLQY